MLKRLLVALLVLTLAAPLACEARHGRGAPGPGTTLQITTASLPAATVGSAYTTSLAASGGTPPYTWNQVVFNPNTHFWQVLSGGGVLSGTPQMTETESDIIQVNDAVGNTAQVTLPMTVGVSGALTILNSTTLPNGTNGGVYFQQMLASGGTPPYQWWFTGDYMAQYVLVNNANFDLMPDGWLAAQPGAAETDSVPGITVYDAAGNSATYSGTVTFNNTLAIQGIDPVQNVVHFPQAFAGTAYGTYSTGIRASGGTAPYTCSISSGTLPAGLSLSGCQISGTPTYAGAAASVVLKVTDNVSATATAPLSLNVINKSTASRPGYNTGSGFFVANGKFYDYNGNEFQMHGINRNHFDQTAVPAFSDGQWNIFREFTYFTPTGTSETVANMVSAMEEAISHHAYPILVMSGYPNETFTGTTSTGSATVTGVTVPSDICYNGAGCAGNNGATVAGSCITGTLTVVSVSVGSNTVTLSGNPSTNGSCTITYNNGGTSGGSYAPAMTGITNWIVANMASFQVTYNGQSLMNQMAIELGNEWGPSNSSVWETTYNTMVTAIRAAGWTAPLFIDSGGSGQDEPDLINYSAAVQSNDPQQNIVFAYHMYNQTTNFTMPMASYASGTNAVGTVTSALAFNPFSVPNSGYAFFTSTGDSWFPTNSVDISGAVFTSGSCPQFTVTNSTAGTFSTSSPWTFKTGVNTSTGCTGTYVANSATITDHNSINLRVARLAALRSSNVPVWLEEYGGPGICAITGPAFCHGSGPSQTTTTIQQIKAAAAANLMGEEYWALDDHNITPCTESNWYCVQLNNTGATLLTYSNDSMPGIEETFNPRSGSVALSSQPTAY